MALRSSWEGFLRLNLISIPVKAYSAAITGRGKIAFHQIHAKCRNRIRYKKVCPVHGEVPNDEIVSGYEVAKGQYALIEPKELEALRADADKAINIDIFIAPDALDPAYFTDRTYYLAPDGKVGQKPYAVLHEVMAKESRAAIATMVLSGREQVVMLRPVERLLAITVLSYDAQIKKPTAFEDEVPEVHVAGEELKLAKTLIEATTVKEFDFAKYRDEYTSQVMKLIEAQAAGKKLTPAASHDEPVIINLIDALRQSLREAKNGPPAKGHSRIRPRVAKTAHRSKTAHAKRKTG